MDTPRRKLRNLHMVNVQNSSTPIRVPPSPMLKRLGHGTGVSVYRLDRSPRCGQIRSPWAVKRLNQNMRVKKDTLFNERIVHEAEILRKLQHPNIVGFRGVITNEEGLNTLALEMCTTSLGSILEERHDEDLGPLQAKHTYKMIMDVALALDFLHTEARLLHGDLKSFNILVKGEFEICKLCDFGVSLPLDEQGEINFVKNPELRYVGTSLWCAPEVMDDVDIIDSKADIFSFGLVIYETLALVPPHTLELDAALGEDMDSSHDLTTDAEKLQRKHLTFSDNESKGGKDPEVEEEHTDNDMSQDVAEEEKKAVEEEEDDTKENDISDFSLNNLHSAYGTRPPLPVAFQLSDDYNCIVELFYLCTNTLSEDRPAAKTVWQCLENNSANVTTL
ncbi:lymphokine-activated killer T-cell-originated protein kinase isoform X2 [Drosophila ficusphila]|uniref:lymphokine-activated killer T-cell-originated protein kinase isoform X2 n=1 Tax=Drosophila ficusphila TaxID=30025 RepID=UPI0007E8039D|nr:lymphokine-activated killer T-cell-originated protein kinase isoform X2 [Drosophila ficusphila]